MKDNIRICLVCLLGLLGVSACSNQDAAPEPEHQDKGIELTGITISTPNGIGVGTRAIEDYAVLGANDPTFPFESKQTWKLDVQIYKDAVPYTYGAGTFVWNDPLWVAQTVNDVIYFPNYTKQRIALKLYPDTWNDVIATDQSTSDKLLAQDVMVEESDTIKVNPAHKPEMKVKHGHSMLDFILKYVEDEEIVSVKVMVDEQEYIPYKVPGVGQEEYMLIVPVGIEDPVIQTETAAGAQYQQTVYTSPTKINTCYAFTLLGIELTLSAIMVADWTTGQALDGEYSSETSYPTFRGPADVSCVVYYDNGLQQLLTFNSRGETTVRPLGRSINRIVSPDLNVDTDITPPLAVRGMVVNLNPYLI